MNTLDRILNIDWFTNVGQPIPRDLGDVVPVSSWDQACEKCSDPLWEDVSAEARNDLTTHLNAVCKAEFQGWNRVIDQIKCNLEQPWRRVRQMLDEQGLPMVIADCVEWDTMHAVATEYYSHCNPPPFFLELLVVYEQGHFPCGWDGAFPNGRLVVY